MSNNNRNEKRVEASDNNSSSSNNSDNNTSARNSTVRPRRSVRLQEAAADKIAVGRSDSPMKRVNEGEPELEEGESNRNRRRKIYNETVKEGDNEVIRGNDPSSVDNSTSTGPVTLSLPSDTTQMPTNSQNIRQNISPTLSSVSPPIFSISIGFGPMPSSFGVSSPSSTTHFINSGNQQDLPPEIRQMIENMTESIQNGTNRSSTTFRSVGDGIGLGITGISIPIGVMVDGSSANLGAGGNIPEFLELARQMYQIITRGRSSNNNTPTSQEFATISEDLEPLLNDFFTRIFGGMPSSAPAGLSSERIAQLPETIEKTEIDCSICREIGEIGEEKCVELPCKHSFHFECIEPWLKRVSSCPICRKVIE